MDAQPTGFQKLNIPKTKPPIEEISLIYQYRYEY